MSLSHCRVPSPVPEPPRCRRPSRGSYLREESIPAADVFVTAEAVAGLAAAADPVPPAALYLEPAAAAEAPPPPPPATSLWPCGLASLWPGLAPATAEWLLLMRGAADGGPERHGRALG